MDPTPPAFATPHSPRHRHCTLSFPQQHENMPDWAPVSEAGGACRPQCWESWASGFCSPLLGGRSVKGELRTQGSLIPRAVSLTRVGVHFQNK